MLGVWQPRLKARKNDSTKSSPFSKQRSDCGPGVQPNPEPCRICADDDRQTACREILADDKLRKIFGKAKVTMFEMNKHLTGHLK